MGRIRNSPAVVAAISFLALAAACGSSDSEGQSQTAANEPGSSAAQNTGSENPGLPEDVNDPRCRGVSSERFEAARSTFQASLRSGFTAEAIRPLSTATPRPGAVQVNAYATLVGGSIACFLAGEEAMLAFGGTHEYGSDLLLRFTLTVPDGLSIGRNESLELLPEGGWTKEFEMPGPRPSSGIVSIRLASAVPGKYEVTLLSEWFDLETMTPIDDGGQTTTRTLTYYTLPK